MSFSLRTAEWLTSVTENPRDFGLVYNFLVEALSTSSHPLGRLMDRFVSVMEASFGSSADSHALAVYCCFLHSCAQLLAILLSLAFWQIELRLELGRNRRADLR